MFDVYIRNFKQNGSLNTNGWHKMFSVPLSDNNGASVTNPSVKGSEDSADSFDFNMEPGSPYYDSFIQMKTLVRVEYSGVNIFYGRCLTVSGSTIYQTRAVHCEGAFAFLNDSYYEGIPDKSRQEMSWNTYLGKVIENHNAMVGTPSDSSKVIDLGTVDFTPSIENKKWEPTGWSQSSSLLNTLKDECGGHMLARYEPSNGKTYLDWYKYYKRDRGTNKRPVVEVGRNILDLTLNSDVGNLFTRVIPVGKTDNNGDRIYINGYTYKDKSGASHTWGSAKYMPVNLLPSLYYGLTDEFHNESDYTNAESDYGIIYKTQEFSDCETQESLWDECKKWIKDSFYGAVTSFEVRAIDMHLTNTNLPMIILGECVDVKYRIIENGQVVVKGPIKLVCKSVKYDLFNPDNNTYTLGIPSDLLKVAKSTSESKSNSKKSASQAASTPPSTNYDPPDTELTFAKIIDIIREDPDVSHGYGGTKGSTDPQTSAADSFRANGEMSGTATCYDSSWHYDPIGHPEGNITAHIVGKITLPGRPTKWIAFNNANGLFAYLDSTMPSEYDDQLSELGIIATSTAVHEITHWYIKSAGYTFTAKSPTAYATKEAAIAGTLNFIGYSPEKEAFVKAGANGLYTGKLSPVGLAYKTMETMSLQFNTGILGLLTQVVHGGKNQKTIELDPQKSMTRYGYDLESGTGETAMIDGFHAAMRFFGLDTASDPNKKESASIQGNTGSVFSKILGAGKDGTGNLSTIISDGTKSIFSLLGLGNAGSTQETDKTVELSGGDGTPGADGKIKTGRKDDTGWRITLNEPLTYKDSTGTEHTLAKGFVFAEDVQLDGFEQISSLRSKIIVSDRIVAGKVDAATIEADLAYIRALNANSITTANYCSAKTVRGTTLYVSNNAYVGGKLYLADADDNDQDVGKCFDGATMTESGGVIKLTLSRINGTDPKEVSFNMAATTFYKNAVAAAKSDGIIEGRNSIYGYGYSTPLNPGGQTTVTLGYSSPTGANVPIGKSYTIKARSLRLRSASVTPTKDGTTVSPGSDSGGVAYDGLSSVQVYGDNNLVSENIKDGVKIFNVTGNYSGSSASVEDISIWEGQTRWSGNMTMSSTTTLEAWAIVNGTWTKGQTCTITPSGGGGGSHSVTVGSLIGPLDTETAIKNELPNSTTKVSPDTKGKWYGVEVSCGSSKRGIYWKTPS